MRTTHLRFVPIVLALLACHSANPGRTPVSPRPGDVCRDLAHVFFLVADARDRGHSRTEQLDAMREGVDNPFTTEQERTLAGLDRIVDLVYRYPEAEAEEIAARVREDCTTSRRGHAVLRTPWPGE